MSDTGALLARIADALERLAPKPAANVDWHGSPAYRWDGTAAHAVDAIDAPHLAQLRGIDRAKNVVTDNISRHANGHAAHDMLLWGARGMGKSALLRAGVAHVQASEPAAMALVQVDSGDLGTLPDLFDMLRNVERQLIVFVDDLGFAEGDSVTPRRLRSLLEGGVSARPGNIRLAVTSNRRAIVARDAAEQDNPLNLRDEADDHLALADRFGISLGFHNCDQETYLAIVEGYAEQHGLEWARADALEWAKRRGARSGRVAWQYVVELAGRAGRAVQP